MKRIIAILLLLAALTSPTFAEEGAPAPETTEQAPTVVIGNFTEAATGRFDYNMTYVVVGTDELRVQLDRFDNPANLLRVWLNSGAIEILREDDLSLSIRPGVIADTKDRVYFGGFADLDVGHVLHVHYRGYGGAPGDKHVVFSSLALTPEVGIQHYLYAETGATPDSYVGATVKLGDLSLWGGPSTNRSGAWALDASLQIRF